MLDINWMPREKWDALVRGEGCPLCGEILKTEPLNEFGYTVADLKTGRLRLCSNQYVKGYCVLIYKKHVREPYELSPEEQQEYFKDVMTAGEALEKAFGADKMNFQILGNLVPHLHCHLIPRYYGDPAPGRPIDPEAEAVTLVPGEYQKTRRGHTRSAGRGLVYHEQGYEYRSRQPVVQQNRRRDSPV